MSKRPSRELLLARSDAARQALRANYALTRLHARRKTTALRRSARFATKFGKALPALFLAVRTTRPLRRRVVRELAILGLFYGFSRLRRGLF